MQQIEITRKMGLANVAASINTSSFNADNNEVEVVFATETLVEEEMPDGERFYEQVEISNAAADLTRLNSNGPVLDSHDNSSVKKQMGVVVRAWVDESTKEAKAIVRLSKSEEWATVVNDVKDGIIKNISFRFRRMRMIDTGEVKDNKRILRTVKWEASEISFVTIPADIKAGVRNAGTEYDVTIIENKNDHTMTPEQKNELTTQVKDVVRKLGLDETFADELLATDGITVDIARAKAIDKVQELKDAADAAGKPVNVDELKGKEKQRALEIIGICRKLNLDKVTNEKGEFFADELISQNVSLDVARAKAIDKAAEIDLSMNKPTGVTSFGMGNDAREAKRAEAKQHAILERAGVVLFDEKGEKIKYDADVYRGMTLKEIAFEGLIERGLNPRNMSVKELKQYILNPEYAVRSSSGSLTTSDFPSITENVLNKVALQRYQLAERTWEPLVRKRTVRDFKPISNVRLNDVVVDETSQILEGGEYTMVKMTDSKETYAIKKYGKKAVLSWEALINDDLSMFNDTVAIVVDGFTQFQNKLFYQLLNSTTALASGANKMADGQLLFHASHNNIATAGVINVDNLGAARKLLRQQTAPNGSLLNLNPKFLVVGPEYEQLAEQYTSSNYVATEQGKINKLGASLTPIVDANITGNKWFLFATPQSIPTIEVAHLEGQEMYTESRYSFDVDGMEVKFRFTNGIKAIDHRGIVKNAGA